jgi:hypothetical protein
MAEQAPARPELIRLDSPARHRVHDQLAAKGGYCESCGGTEFNVGDALYLGFLFLDEDDDAYMVALTCCNRACTRPHTGIVLHASQFRVG